MNKGHKYSFTVICTIVLFLIALASIDVTFKVHLAQTSSISVDEIIPSNSEIQELLDQASYVLVGNVVKIESNWNPQKTQIYSDATISVEEVLRGDDVSNQVVVQYLGGEVEGLGQIVSSEASFTLGERVEVYLTTCQEGKFSVVAGDRGKISLSSQNIESE